jgi:hypothetical protein
MMKAILVAVLLISGAAQANVEFTKGGAAHLTTGADGAVIAGQEALNFINALNVHPTRSQGYLNYNISLSGQKPATSGGIVTCSVADSNNIRTQLLSAECYIGNVN